MFDPLNPDGELGRKRQRRRDAAAASHANDPPKPMDATPNAGDERHEVRRIVATQPSDAAPDPALPAQEPGRNRPVLHLTKKHRADAQPKKR